MLGSRDHRVDILRRELLLGLMLDGGRWNESYISLFLLLEFEVIGVLLLVLRGESTEEILSLLVRRVGV